MALTGSVLLALTLAKMVQSVPYLGASALVLAAFWQLHVPIWRAECHHLSLQLLGLHTRHWTVEVFWACGLAALILPLHALGYHWAVTSASTWLVQLQLPTLHFDPARLLSQPVSSLTFAALQALLTQLIGVALPEELFYRGYLLPFIQQHLKNRGPQRVALHAAVYSSCIFALAHFLGEWRLSRLGPFFPSLLFCWQRNQRRSIVGCTLLHAACNLFAALWAQMYHF